MRLINRKELAKIKGWFPSQISTWLKAGLLPAMVIPGYWTDEQVDDMFAPTCGNLRNAWRFHLEQELNARYKASYEAITQNSSKAVLESDCATDKKPLKAKKSGCTADKKQKKKKTEKKSCVNSKDLA